MAGRLPDRVFVHNVQDLVVERNICVHLAIYNAANISFSSTSTCSHQDYLSLKLVDSTTNLVPSYITHLDMKGSSAQEVVCHNDLQFFTVINSDLGLLDILQPVRNITVKLEDSKIDVLAKLILESKSQLFIVNVTINTLGQNSVHVLEASVNIWASNIKSSRNQAITLGPKSTLSIRDVDGKVTFAGPPQDVDDKGTLNTPENMDDKERLDALQDESGISTSPKFDHKSQNPRRSPKHPSNSYTPAHRCINSSPLIWLLPTLLATVEAFIIIANCTNWFPALKSRQIRRGVEEGGRSIGNSQDGGASHADPTWYYSRETLVPSHTNMRQRVNNKDA
ncbi:uncharacterized protein LOC121874145 isoform X2 [Homarus americanus]|nr:uncharacterized protein LOC121874145 isoform X2 [Homarus americanus]XP_042234049.1 uncharacterized protein LOC121874145 isoform X2 [Homarus americanus]